MDFQNNPDFDEDGQPLIYPDAAGYSDTEDWANRQRSPTPPYHSPAVDATARRRRLVKSAAHTTDAREGDELADGGGDLDDWDEMERQNRADDDEEYEVERKKEKKRKERERDGRGGKGSGKMARRAHEVDEGEREIQEMWDTIAGDGEVDTQHYSKMFFSAPFWIENVPTVIVSTGPKTCNSNDNPESKWLNCNVNIKKTFLCAVAVLIYIC